MMKIALHNKTFIIKACFSTAVFVYMVAQPSHAYAGFFSDLVAKVIGPSTQAAEPVTPVVESTVHNSQNVPLLESSINPDLKNIKEEPVVQASSPADAIALASDGTLDADSDLEKYASTEKISTYTVKKGDTLETISAKLKVPQSTIVASNTDLKKSDLLKIGQKLVILALKDADASTSDAASDTPDTVKKTDTADKADASKDKDEKAQAAKDDKAKAAAAKDKEDAAKKDEPKKDEGPMYVINTDLTPFSPSQPVTNPIPETPQINLPIGGATTPAVTTPAPASGQPSGTIDDGYIWPFPAGVGRISQGRHADNALDFAAPKGTPIYAVHSGSVLLVHPTGWNGGFGKYVVINFDDGRQAIFAHMNETIAIEGHVVKQGDLIGYVGTTGDSTGPHTHIGFHGSLSNPYIGLKVNSTSKDFHD